MSSASLAAPRHAHPDSVRIAAMSVAMALNLAALLALLRPMAPELAQRAQHAAAIPISWILAKKEPPPPLPINLKKITEPKAVPHTQAIPRPQPVTPPVVNTSDVGTVPAPPAVPLAPPQPAVDAAPVEATLAYRATPLKYPPQALHSRLQGQVILRVLVDENGVPQDVVVEQSSGYTLLDRSARDQVLKGWRFEPATAGGHAVRAWARVPVTFNLNEL